MNTIKKKQSKKESKRQRLIDELLKKSQRLEKAKSMFAL